MVSRGRFVKIVLTMALDSFHEGFLRGEHVFSRAGVVYLEKVMFFAENPKCLVSRA